MSESTPKSNLLSRALVLWLSTLATTLLVVVLGIGLSLSFDYIWGGGNETLLVLLAATIIPTLLIVVGRFYINITRTLFGKFELEVPSFWNTAVALLMAHVVAQALTSVPVLISDRPGALGMASIFQLVLFLGVAAWIIERPVDEQLARIVGWIAAAAILVSVTLVSILAIGTAAFVFNISQPDRDQARIWVQTAAEEQGRLIDSEGWDGVMEASNSYTLNRPKIKAEAKGDRFVYIVSEDEDGTPINPSCQATMIHKTSLDNQDLGYQIKCSAGCKK